MTSRRVLALAAACLAAAGAASILAAATHATSAAAKPKPGKILFVAACGSCHTLAAAGTRGRKGGNLAEERRSFREVVARIRRGGEGMPSFAKTLRPRQIGAIAAFVAVATARGHVDDD